MVNPNRSADSAYYAAKQPLNIRGTREGRKNSRPSYSYRQTASDAAASSNKYYADNKPVSKSAPPPKKTVTVEASAQTARKLVAAFASGATDVVVDVQEAELSRVRTSIEVAVGQGKLTREQSDSVAFNVIKAVEPEPAPEPIVEKPKKKRGRPKKKKAAEPVIEEAESILEPQASEEAELLDMSEGITEDDVAKAFGVDLNADDDSDD